MNDASTPIGASPVPPLLPAPRPSIVGPAMPARRLWLAAAVALLLVVLALAAAWRADQRVRSVEQELVRRQQDSAGQSAEARLAAKQAQEASREATAKIALLEARVAEVALQRSQLEELMQSLSRSRDENVLTDVEAAIRVAVQQSAITGSAEPLVATLKQSDDRLARYNQARLEGVRRAIVRDLDRVRGASVADISSLTIKLDEAIRMVDELVLTGNAAGRADSARAGSATAATPGSAAAASGDGRRAGWDPGDAVARVFGAAWAEVRSLVRVTRIDHPDAMLMSPEQGFFVKENLKLRLLNARLALLSRQFDTAQSDLRGALVALDRYFDHASRRTALAAELIRQVAGQARQGGVPRPDDTLAAVAAAAAGR